MSDKTKTKEQLIKELRAMRKRVAELEVVEAERKRAEERIKHLNLVLRAIRNVNQLIAKENDRDRLLKGVCDSLIETRGYHNAWIALLDESRNLLTTAEAGLGKDFSVIIEQIKRSELPECGRRALKESGVVAIEDPSAICEGCSLLDKSQGSGVLSVRLEYGGKVYGFITVSIPVHFVTDEEELALLSEVAGDLAFALNSIELEEKREQAVEALLESEVRFRGVFESPMMGMLFWDANGDITDANDAFLQMVGYTRDEILSGAARWRDMTPPEYKEQDDKALEEIATSGVMTPIEKEYIRKDGIHIPILLGAASLPGPILRGFAFVLDITDKKRTEAERDELLYDMSERVKDLNCLYGVSKLVAETDKPLEEILQETVNLIPPSWQYPDITCARIVFEEHEFKTKNFTETNWKLSADIIVSRKKTGIIEVHYLEEMPEEHEGPFIREEGDLIDDLGRQLGAIAERKQAEEQVLRKSAVLEAINKVFQETLVCETVEEVAYTCINMAEELTGSKYGLIGEINEAGEFDTLSYGDLRWAICKMPESEAITLSKNMIIRGIWGQAILKGKSQIVNDPTSHPETVGTPEGHPQIKCFMGVPLKYAGKTIGMIGLANKEDGYEPTDQEAVESLSVAFVEAFHRKRAEVKLKEYSENLQEMVEERTKDLKDAQELLVRKEKLAVLGQLAGGVGHELRNPLGAIKNAAYFLNMVLENPEPEIEETLDVLNKEVAISERIISSLLGFARPKPPVKKKVNLNQIVQDALSRTTVPGKVEVEKQLEETLPTTLADPDQLTQVFGNIILNGIQAMPEGGRLEIKSETTAPERVAVSISDTGEGISDKDLNKIFEPLFTTKAKGIGLGLALTRILVEANGGSISVESETGKGSTFRVKLPVSGSEEV